MQNCHSFGVSIVNYWIIRVYSAFHSWKCSHNTNFTSTYNSTSVSNKFVTFIKSVGCKKRTIINDARGTTVYVYISTKRVTSFSISCSTEHPRNRSSAYPFDEHRMENPDIGARSRRICETKKLQMMFLVSGEIKRVHECHWYRATRSHLMTC